MTQLLTKLEKLEYMEDHGPVWELYDPRMGQCSVCATKLPKGEKPILELRHTGIAGRKQLWPYCPPCAVAFMGKGVSAEGIPRVMGCYDGHSSIPDTTGHYCDTGSIWDISGSWLLPSLNEVFDFKHSEHGAKQQ